MKKVAPKLNESITVSVTVAELSVIYAALGSVSHHGLAYHIADAPVFNEKERNDELVKLAHDGKSTELYDEVATLLKSEGIDVL